MRSYIRHLHPVNIVLPSDHVVEPVLPGHCHQRVPVIIVEKESRIAVNYFFRLRWLPVLNDGLKHIYHILGYRNLPCSGIGLRGFKDILITGRIFQKPLSVGLNRNQDSCTNPDSWKTGRLDQFICFRETDSHLCR